MVPIPMLVLKSNTITTCMKVGNTFSLYVLLYMYVHRFWLEVFGEKIRHPRVWNEVCHQLVEL